MAAYIQFFVNELLRERRALTSPREHIFKGISDLSTLALLIIGCVGSAGILPGSTMSWTAIALGGGDFAFNLAAGKIRERKISLLTTSWAAIFPVILGSLGAAGLLSGIQIGWGLIFVPLSILVSLAIGIPIGCCIGCVLTVTLMPNGNAPGGNFDERVEVR